MATLCHVMHLLLFACYFCWINVAGKAVYYKDNADEVTAFRKQEMNYTQTAADTSKDFGQRMIGPSKVHHRQTHSREFPDFAVIKCFVEEMTKKKKQHSPTADEIDMDLFSAEADRLCRGRHRRHHHAKNGTSSGPLQTPDVNRIPQDGDRCSAIAAFLANASNLNSVRQKAKDLSCINGDVSRMFDVLDGLRKAYLMEGSRRAKAVRKWNHVACRLYHSIRGCIQGQMRAINGTMSLGKGKDYKARASDVDKADKEAVHVSDSSHINFLNFMIGYNTEDSYDYQMWFY